MYPAVTVVERDPQHHAKEDEKQEWRQHAALLRAVGHFKLRRAFAVLDHGCHHSVMQRTDDVDKCWRAADLAQKGSESGSVYGVAGLRQVCEHSEHLALLLSAYLLDPPHRERHVRRTATGSKTALALRGSKPRAST